MLDRLPSNLDRYLWPIIALFALTIFASGYALGHHRASIPLLAAEAEADSMRVMRVQAMMEVGRIERHANSLIHVLGLYLTADPAARRGDLYGVGLEVTDR